MKRDEQSTPLIAHQAERAQRHVNAVLARARLTREQWATMTADERAAALAPTLPPVAQLHAAGRAVVRRTPYGPQSPEHRARLRVAYYTRHPERLDSALDYPELRPLRPTGQQARPLPDAPGQPTHNEQAYWRARRRATEDAARAARRALAARVHEAMADREEIIVADLARELAPTMAYAVASRLLGRTLRQAGWERHTCLKRDGSGSERIWAPPV